MTRSGGGINSRVVSQVKAGKSEPVSYPVSPNRPSEIGLSHYYSTDPLKNYSTPRGPSNNLDCRPGGNNREILKAGSQAPCRPPTPMSPGRKII
jgi:hypothetical protein